MAKKKTDQRTLMQVWEEDYYALRLRSARPNSIRLWQITLRHFDRFLGRPAMLADLNDGTLLDFIEWRRESGVAGSTINRDLYNLLSFWRWCVKFHLVNESPNVKLEIEPVQTPRAWTQDEFDQLIRAILRLQGNVGEVPARDFWLALVLTLFDTAERIGAVLSIQWFNVDFERGFIRFPAEDRKGGRQDHIAEVSDETLTSLEQLLPKRTRGLVFYRPGDQGSIWRHFGSILKSAGLPHDRSSKFHRIRKTTASHYEQAGGNATRLLGHAFRRTTEQYLDPRIVKTQPAHELLFPPIPKTTHKPSNEGNDHGAQE